MSSARADASQPLTGRQSRADLSLSGFLLPTVSETRPSAASGPLPPDPVPRSAARASRARQADRQQDDGQCWPRKPCHVHYNGNLGYSVD
jgi:hypothetical protein